MAFTVLENKTLRFRIFFDKNFPKVKSFASGLLKSEEDAEDIAQDVFLKLWETPELWDNGKDADAYLFTSVRNKVYDFLRHKTVEQDYLEVAVRRMRNSESGQYLPDDECDVRALAVLLQMKIDGMPEQRKRIFRMSRFDGMKSADIAERLGISVRTVDAHIYKALRDLKNEIAVLKKVLPFIIFFCFFFDLEYASYGRLAHQRLFLPGFSVHGGPRSVSCAPESEARPCHSRKDPGQAHTFAPDP